MRTTQWIISLFLATSLCASAAMAADATPAAAKEATLEKIDAAPATNENMNKDCPFNHNIKQCKHEKKGCAHKNGEPCPYPQGEKHRGKSPEQCDYKKRG